MGFLCMLHSGRYTGWLRDWVQRANHSCLSKWTTSNAIIQLGTLAAIPLYTQNEYCSLHTASLLLLTSYAVVTAFQAFGGGLCAVGTRWASLVAMVEIGIFIDSIVYTSTR